VNVESTAKMPASLSAEMQPIRPPTRTASTMARLVSGKP
jgi:hypothetical protein